MRGWAPPVEGRGQGAVGRSGGNRPGGTLLCCCCAETRSPGWGTAGCCFEGTQPRHSPNTHPGTWGRGRHVVRQELSSFFEFPIRITIFSKPMSQDML